MGEIAGVTTLRHMVTAGIAAATLATPALAAASKGAHGESPLTLPLVLIAIGAAVIIAGVAVYRQSDEFGAMATVLEELRHSAGEAARLVTKPATRHATGDRREAVMDRRS